MITTVVYLFGLKAKYVCGASHHAEVATFASFYVYGDSTYDFGHVVIILFIIPLQK
jgi:hypothetical protein